jgi:hypothetical protein
MGLALDGVGRVGVVVGGHGVGGIGPGAPVGIELIVLDRWGF